MITGRQRIQVVCLQGQDKAAGGLEIILFTDGTAVHGNADKTVKRHIVPNAALYGKYKVFSAALGILVSLNRNGINRIFRIGVNIGRVFRDRSFGIWCRIPAAGLAAGCGFCARTGDLGSLQLQDVPFMACQDDFAVITSAVIPFTVDHAEGYLHTGFAAEDQIAGYISDIVIGGRILFPAVQDLCRGWYEFIAVCGNCYRTECMTICSISQFSIFHAGFGFAAFRDCLGFCRDSGLLFPDDRCDTMLLGAAVGFIADGPVPNIISFCIDTGGNVCTPAGDGGCFSIRTENILHRAIFSCTRCNKLRRRTCIGVLLSLRSGLDGCCGCFYPSGNYRDLSGIVIRTGTGYQYFGSRHTDQVYTADVPETESHTFRGFKSAYRKFENLAFIYLF